MEVNAGCCTHRDFPFLPAKEGMERLLVMQTSPSDEQWEEEMRGIFELSDDILPLRQICLPHWHR